jgi:putative hydrolase of the HAD superfamily
MKTIFFDLDETLAVERDAIAACFAATCAVAGAGTGVDPAVLTARVRDRARTLWRGWAHYADFCVPIGISSWEGLTGLFTGDGEYLRRLREFVPGYRVDAWHWGLRQAGIDDAELAARLAARLVAERENRHSLFPDAQAAVDDARRRGRVGLITNGVSVIQRGKLKATGLEGQFDPVLVSGEVGAGKPDEAIFRRAMELTGSVPADCVMVGDSRERDIAGARAVGWHTVWLNRYGKAASDIVPEVTVSSLLDLPAVLDRWG